MLQLRLKAPYAAFRLFTAGSYRPTAPFLTPSAAYGLLLNLAAIESRRDDEQTAMTLTADNLPTCDVAVGAVSLPEVQSLYQQLHNYPVGQTGKERADDARGNKYNIQPIRRELLSDVDAYICLRSNDWLESRVREGLLLGARYRPEGKPRYGLPFLGDNNFLISVLREETSRVQAYWYVPVAPNQADPLSDLGRLTVRIDRQDTSRTVTRLYGRMETPALDIPSRAWTTIEPRGSQ
ncbi:MAG: CRISPR-associated protein Cas5 [Chloroflexota bacterium]|nr:MAG: CRISPR-associated protein Cas5 [Chloroflexota bacterium]